MKLEGTAGVEDTNANVNSSEQVIAADAEGPIAAKAGVAKVEGANTATNENVNKIDENTEKIDVPSVKDAPTAENVNSNEKR